MLKRKEVNNGVYRYKGKTYSMKAHGFARDMDFELVEKTESSVRLRKQAVEHRAVSVLAVPSRVPRICGTKH